MNLARMIASLTTAHAAFSSEQVFSVTGNEGLFNVTKLRKLIENQCAVELDKNNFNRFSPLFLSILLEDNCKTEQAFELAHLIYHILEEHDED